MMRVFGRFVSVVGVLIAVFAIAGCSDSIGSVDDAWIDGVGEDDGHVGTGWAMRWDESNPAPESAMPDEEIELVAVVTYNNNPMANIAVDFEIVRGGGMLESSTVFTGVDGRADVLWKVGIAPVGHAVRASIDEAAVFVDHMLMVEPETAITPVPFGEIEALLSAASISESTEGIAFDDSGNLWLAAGNNLIRMDHQGDSTLVPVGNDGLENPLGMAWDYLRHAMWVADTASIRKVTFNSDGTAVTATSTMVSALEGLITPNSIAVGDNRYVYFTDSCTGGVYRFEPDADTVELQTVVMFDVTTQGGPNGIAFDENGLLWVTTENVGLLCPDSGADVTASHGGLYSIDISGGVDAGPIQPVARLQGFAMFGDGLAFDRDGNMYVIFDTFDGFTLTDSSVWYVPADPALEPVKVVSAPVADDAAGPNVLIANIAWGQDDFGSEKMYMSLLAVPMVTSTRGAMMADVGISGMSLLPNDLPD